MEVNKAWLFFEQSGIFKRAFQDLGIDAEDIDIQNEYGETNRQLDLFSEIEKAYQGKKSLLDEINQKDLTIAFFPCVYFSCTSQMQFNVNFKNYKNLTLRERIEKILERNRKRSYFYETLIKMYTIFRETGKRLVIENPWAINTYLKGNFIVKPSYIDTDRTRRGDKFVKPTAFYFVNCVPGNGFTISQCAKSKRSIIHCKKGKKAGICSKERSEITPIYAKNFINDLIMYKEKSVIQEEMSLEEL